MLDVFYSLENRLNIDLQNKNGETVLHLCCKQTTDNKDMLQVVKYLMLKCSADVHKKNNIGDSPLELAKRS